MKPSVLVTVLLGLCLCIGCIGLAQPSAEEAEAALARAVQALQEATSYHFAYDVSPSVDATSNITGEGQADLGARAWRYTLQSDPGDPNADRSKDGEWIVVDSAWYHNPGTGWTLAGPDFTNSGITGILAPFASYGTLQMLGTEETFEVLHWVGQEVVDGVEMDHYRFSFSDLPLYGTGAYDLWLAEEEGRVVRVVLAVTPEGRATNTVRYSNIGEPVSIAVPR
jgi:hypothetical protein